MYNSDLMILSGAGASIPVGIPGMVGMADQFRRDLPKGSDARKGYDLLREFGAGSDLEELLELANDISDFSDSELDEFVDSCVGRGQKKTARLRDYHRQRNLVIARVEAFREELLDWLKRACLDYNKEDAYHIYADLVATIADKGIPVFTTNYDGVWEHVANNQGIPVVDNFVEEDARQFWDESLEAYQAEGLRVVKLHGSVYWHASKDGRIEKLDPPSSVNSDGHPVERLVIVPTRFKDIYQRNYFPLYTNFLRTLGQARALVVLGHSLRDEYLSAAIRDRLREENFHLILVDPSIEIQSDLVSGASKPKEQLVHVKTGAEQLAQVYEHFLGSSSTVEAISLARKLEKTVADKRTANLEIIDAPNWLEGGAKNSVRIRVSTALRAGELAGDIQPDKMRENSIDIAAEVARAWKEAPEIGPLQEFERSVSIYIRKSIGRGPHQLVFRLLDHVGDELASASKNFRIKGI